MRNEHSKKFLAMRKMVWRRRCWNSAGWRRLCSPGWWRYGIPIYYIVVTLLPFTTRSGAAAARSHTRSSTMACIIYAVTIFGEAEIWLRTSAPRHRLKSLENLRPPFFPPFILVHPAWPGPRSVISSSIFWFTKFLHFFMGWLALPCHSIQQSNRFSCT